MIPECSPSATLSRPPRSFARLRPNVYKTSPSLLFLHHLPALSRQHLLRSAFSSSASSLPAMFTDSRPAPSWTSLPAEMKLAIVDQLDLDDVRALAKVNHESYQLSIPSLFRVCTPQSFATMAVISPPTVRPHPKRRGARPLCHSRPKILQPTHPPTHHLHQTHR